MKDLIIDPDPAKLLGVRRAGAGASLYKRVLRLDPCSYCGLEPAVGPYGGQQVDHIRSRFNGGENHWTNYTAACPFCNLAKHDLVLGHLLALCDFRREGYPRRDFQ